MNKYSIISFLLLSIWYLPFVKSQNIDSVFIETSNNRPIDSSIIQLPEVEVFSIGYGTSNIYENTSATATISAEKLGKQASPNPLKQLQGRLAGVQIVSESGQPGDNIRVRIRGIGTINNSDPIYVVDGFQSADIDYLAPTDIEKIEVLKDASATAIYGARGANGVVLITTKKNENKRLYLGFDAYGGVGYMRRFLPVNNASEYAKLRLQAFENDQLTPDPSMAAKLNNAANSNEKGTDWQKEISRPATISSYSLNMDGGDSLFKWRLSGTLFDQKGTLKNSSLKKYFLRFGNDYQLMKWLKGGISLYFTRSEQNYNNANEYTGGLNNAVTTDPITGVRNPENNNWDYAELSTVINPARANDLQKNNLRKKNQFVSIVYLEAKPIKDLSLKTTLGTRLGLDHNTLYVPVYNVGPWEKNDISLLLETRGQSLGNVWTNTASYSKKIGMHNVQAIVGAEWQLNQYSATNISTTNVPENDQERYISSSLGNPSANTLGSNQGANALSSYFTRVSYHYNGKYLVQMSIRRDGSSKFSKSNRWGNFPAISIGWNMAKEAFLSSQNTISLLKWRAGWGKTGNQNGVSDYASYTLINGGNNYSFGGTQVAGFTITDFGNSLLRWEKTETQNIGLDLGLWQDRLSFSADYFVRNTTDMIIPLPSPLYAGANGAMANSGSIRNKGLEYSVSYRNSEKAKVHVELGANFTSIQNKVINVSNAPIKGGMLWSIGYMTQTDAGMPVGSFWGLKTDGIFHSQEEADAYRHNGNKIQPNAQAGDVKFVDQNGDGTIDEKDYVNIGSPLPKFTYGFSSSIAFKGFDLYVYLMGVQGNQIVNGLNVYSQSPTGQFNSTTNRQDAWTSSNPNSNEPRMTVNDLNQNNRFSDRYVEDGSYLRLQNLSLGYTFNLKYIQKLKIDRFRIYLAADNLITKTKYKGFDPEIGQTVANGSHPLNYGIDFGNYPQPRTYRAGMSLLF